MIEISPNKLADLRHIPINAIIRSSLNNVRTTPIVIHNVTTLIPNILIRLVVTLAKDYCLIYSIEN